MNCPKCKTENSENRKVCINCGTLLSTVIKNEEEVLELTALKFETPKRETVKKSRSEILAALFFPGIGHLLKGYYITALIYIVITVILIFLGTYQVIAILQATYSNILEEEPSVVSSSKNFAPFLLRSTLYFSLALLVWIISVFHYYSQRKKMDEEK